MSQLLFWNKQNNNNNSSSNHSNGTNAVGSNGSSSLNEGKNGKRNWLHTPDALVNGHVVYLVKFFGNLPVEQAKGIEVVKDAIRKLQFAQQMKKAETGTQEKFKKVEITISVDGVAVQEPRTQKILHQFPLHNISYCADEKGVKKFFSFIAKTTKTLGDTVNNVSPTNSSTSETDAHECFVFISNKLASDITLTIGQAFDLAYRKYISSTEKTDLGKAQQQINELEKNLTIYKNRLREISLKLPKSELETLLFKLGIKDILELPKGESTAMIMNGNSETAKPSTDNDTEKLLIDTASTKSSSSLPYAPIVPPRNNLSSQIMHKSNSQKMDELLLNSDSDSDFDPRADESALDGTTNGRNDSNDLFGFEPLKSYGQLLFHNNNNNNDHNKLQSTSNNNLTNTNNCNNIINNGMNHNGLNNTNNTSFNNDLPPAPLLAPPPKVAAPRRSTSVTNNITNGNTDLFGSDPFEVNGPSIFKSKLSSVSVDDFSLESLDPLRK